MNDNKYYIPHLEWEAVNFPLVITQVKFEKIDYGFKEDVAITIWRNSNYQLKGKITGFIKNPINLNEDIFVGKGNIIKGDTVSGWDANGNSIKILDCILLGFQTNSWQCRDDEYFFEAKLKFESVDVKFISDTESKETTRFEWFLCSHIHADFDKTTFRNLSLPNKKIRVGLDDYDDSIENFIGSSSSRDYINIDLPEVKCIIAKVPDIFLPTGMKGICFEFRSTTFQTPYHQLLKKLKYLLSFLLGNKLIYIGSSIVSHKALREAILYSEKNNLLAENNKNSIPPIKFNRQYDWGNLSWLLYNLLPAYFKLEKTLALNRVLSGYWIAKGVPIGSNLPILANAIEILASKYLKDSGKFQMENIPDEEYLTLIKDELSILENKLLKLNGGAVMINKIKGANKKVPSEKISFFFSIIGLELGKSEKAAMNLRNKMAHSSRDYNDDDKAYDDVVLTRVYEVLFNRVILKLLRYDGYYIDYSITKCPLKHIDKSAGSD